MLLQVSASEQDAQPAPPSVAQASHEPPHGLAHGATDQPVSSLPESSHPEQLPWQPKPCGTSKWKTSGWLPVLPGDHTHAPSIPESSLPCPICVSEAVVPAFIQTLIPPDTDESHDEASSSILELDSPTSSCEELSPSSMQSEPVPKPPQPDSSNLSTATSQAPHVAVLNKSSPLHEAESYAPRDLPPRNRTPSYEPRPQRYGRHILNGLSDSYDDHEPHRSRPSDNILRRREERYPSNTSDLNHGCNSNHYPHHYASPSTPRYYRESRNSYYYDRRSPSPSQYDRRRR